ncbi:HlyD family type I secretion periplasmic adaptor subunit [Variovorax saccharolyticus]|uniref:HlyD family type I secretion periplasmic adaptor subunit n=1 Tax=Variovorax saccharolyticus TaxID=3053516 RepID=UPI002575922F|nr:HlyD family type I secretion periplasmic adaptor subunit [Variovorax sp. J31P216]MDM0024032.1 HlyD family type I secretion periplasmic adaptor subunit [Variovorax sp. J31P216]
MHTATLPSLAPGAGLRSSQEHARRLVRSGCWIVLGAILPLGVWMGFAPLSMAVVAPAYVKVDLNRRPVQHLEGGTVREVLVRDGQHVKAGDPVLVLGDVRVDADRNRLGYRVYVERATLARLEAEQAVAKTLTFSDELLRAAKDDARIQQALQKESGLFQAQRHSLESGTSLMRTQRERVQQEILAVQAQIAQAQSSLALQRSDLEANRGLIKEGFISTSRISQLESVVMEYAAKLEERRTELARAAQRLVEIDLRIQSIRNDYVKAASDQLKATTQRLSEIEQEQRKSDDAAQRQVVVAPASGEIIGLKFTSPGAVVGPGEAIADVVPSDTQLMIEAQIRPEDISNVHVAQRARIKFTAFKYRNTTMVTGKVTYVSGDRLLDRQTNLPYYSVMILADPHSLSAIGDFKLQAGMPAEVYIEGSQQTALQYLIEPITTTVRRAGRQM